MTDPERITRAGGALAIAVALLAAAGTAQAQAPRPKLHPAYEARLLFFKGVTAFRKGAYPDALAHFTRSFELRPKAVVMQNLANTHEALFQYKKAIAAYERFLEMKGARASYWVKTQTAKKIALLRTKLGRIALSIGPPGAEVSVDGKVVGRAPLAEPYRVDPGRHDVTVQLEGHKPARAEVNVTSGQAVSVKLTLERLVTTGKLILSSPIPGAQVAVDGGADQPLPAELELKQGRHRLRVSAPNHIAQRLSVEVHAGKTARRTFTLTPLPRKVVVLPKIKHPKPRGTPIYRKWWFWTIISAVVIGGGATAGYFLWDRNRQVEPDLRWQLR